MAQVIVSNKIRVEGGKDYLELCTHSFYIEDLYFQMDIVDDFFNEMRFSKARVFLCTDNGRIFSSFFWKKSTFGL